VLLAEVAERVGNWKIRDPHVDAVGPDLLVVLEQLVAVLGGGPVEQGNDVEGNVGKPNC